MSRLYRYKERGYYTRIVEVEADSEDEAYEKLRSGDTFNEHSETYDREGRPEFIGTESLGDEEDE